jgi:EAL domain-containing protein (putative c-di-GMP-specific phosphodiesterase class I)
LNLSRLNVHLRIAVNMPVAALVELPVGDIVRVYRPQVTNWPGLVIDITEQQAISEIALVIELTKRLSEYNVRLAIDDFGKGYASLMKMNELPFA